MSAVHIGDRIFAMERAIIALVAVGESRHIISDMRTMLDGLRQEARGAAKPQEVVIETRPVCKWHQQDEGYDTFSTGCGHEFTVIDAEDGNPNLPFCPYCARPVEGHAWHPGDDAKPQGACDMGDLCIGCTPRHADGSCPYANPHGGEVEGG